MHPSLYHKGRDKPLEILYDAMTLLSNAILTFVLSLSSQAASHPSEKKIICEKFLTPTNHDYLCINHSQGLMYSHNKKIISKSIKYHSIFVSLK